jgi:hypothetical protein
MLPVPLAIAITVVSCAGVLLDRAVRATRVVAGEPDFTVRPGMQLVMTDDSLPKYEPPFGPPSPPICARHGAMSDAGTVPIRNGKQIWPWALTYRTQGLWDLCVADKGCAVREEDGMEARVWICLTCERDYDNSRRAQGLR